MPLFPAVFFATPWPPTRFGSLRAQRPTSRASFESLGLAVGGRIMKLLTREQLFAAPKVVSRPRNGARGALQP